MKKIMNFVLTAIAMMVISAAFAAMFIYCLDREAEIQELKARKYFERYPEMRRQMMARYK